MGKPSLTKERILCRKALMELTKSEIVGVFLDTLENYLPEKLVRITQRLVEKKLV